MSRSWPTRPLQYHHHQGWYREWALAEACPRDDAAAKLRASARALKNAPTAGPRRQHSTKTDALVRPLAAKESDAFVATENRRRYGAAVESRYRKSKSKSPPTFGVRRRNTEARSRHRGRCTAVGMCADLPDPGLHVPRPRAYACKVAPLSELATQHIVGERRLVALTRLGVEELGRCRPSYAVSRAVSFLTRKWWSGGAAAA